MTQRGALNLHWPKLHRQRRAGHSDPGLRPNDGKRPIHLSVRGQWGHLHRPLGSRVHNIHFGNHPRRLTAETRAALWAGRLNKRRRKEARFAADIDRQISNALWPRRNAPGAVSPSNSGPGSVRGYGFASPNGPRCIRGRSPNSASSWATRPRPPVWRSSKPTRPTAAKPCHKCGWVDRRDRRSQSGFECGRCGVVDRVLLVDGGDAGDGHSVHGGHRGVVVVPSLPPARQPIS